MARQVSIVSIVCVALVAGYLLARPILHPPALPQIVLPSSPIPAENGYPALDAAASAVAVSKDDIQAITKAGWSANSAQVRRLLKRHARDLAQAHAALKLTCLHAIAPGTSGAIASGDRLSVLVRLMVIEGQSLEKQGEHGEALDCYVDCLRVARAVERNGVLMERLVGVSVQSIGGRELTRLLQSGKLSQGDLKRAHTALTELWETRVPEADTLAVEYVYGAAELHRQVAGGTPGKRPSIFARLFESREQAAHQRLYAAYIERVREPYWQRDPTPPHAGGILAKMTASVLARFEKKVPESDARLQDLMVRATLELYRAERGKYPESLDGLVPEYLGKAPVNPLTGKALEYRRDGEGYQLVLPGPTAASPP